MRSKWRTWLAMLLVLFAGFLTWRVLDDTPQAGFDISGRPECGHDAADTIPSALFAGLEHIPEFHDCQRFVLTSDTGPRYDSLYAIYASRTLEWIIDSLGPSLPNTLTQLQADSAYRARVRNPNAPVPPPDPGSPVRPYHAVESAALVAAEGDYPRLGISRGLNCLYVGRFTASATDGSETWFARMVPNVAREDASCDLRAFGDLPPGTDLQVARSVSTEFTRSSDYPPVARWDWDRREKQQYIGIKCGVAWCEIGPVGFTPSPPLPVASNADSSVRRVRLIKGWYDQQLLAKLTEDGGMQPSGVLGTVIADPRLGQWSDADFLEKHADVAQVVLEVLEGNERRTLMYYQKKYNVHPARYDGPAKLAIRNTAEENPSGYWNARIRRGGLFGLFTDKNVNIVRRAVDRTTFNESYVVPAVARWRWIQGDEGIWTRCTDGCCEMSYY